MVVEFIGKFVSHTFAYITPAGLQKITQQHISRCKLSQLQAYESVLAKISPWKDQIGRLIKRKEKRTHKKEKNSIVRLK